MDFIFTPLPKPIFEMTDAQLVLWQRNAIFECDCDNFLNRRIEAGLGPIGQQIPQLPNLLRRPLVEQSGIDMAIDRHGLHARNSLGSLQRQRARLQNSFSRHAFIFIQEAVLAAVLGF